MRFLAIAIAVLGLACTKSPSLGFHGQADVDAAAWPTQPIAALVEHDPWAMVIGADLPLVEVFADGTVLRADPEVKTDRGFLVSQLTPSETGGIRAFLEGSSGFWELQESYNLAPDCTDQPITEIVLAKDGRQKRVAAYGYSLGTVGTSSCTQLPRSSDPDKLPRVFDRLAKALLSVKPSNSTPWQPRFVEVMIWPYEHSPEEPMPWPSDWPAPGSVDVLPRGDSFSIILPGSSVPSLRAFVGQRREKQAVLFDGRKWSLSYRLVMPGGAVEKQINAVRSAHGA